MFSSTPVRLCHLVFILLSFPACSASLARQEAPDFFIGEDFNDALYLRKGWLKPCASSHL